MKKRNRILTLLWIAVTGMLLTLPAAGCTRTAEFVIREGVDRAWLDAGQQFQVPENGVYLSTRAFKHYSKGCDD